jgi:PAS domain S-box
MFIRLRDKMLSVYAILVLLLLGVSASFIISLFNMGRSMNSLMESNYKSIVAAQNMIEALDGSQIELFNYVIDNLPKETEAFDESCKNFSTFYMRAATNVTEEGEGEVIKNIDSYYKKYFSAAVELQEYTKSHNVADTLSYFNDSVSQYYNETKDACNQLLDINQQAMFASKNKASQDADRSVWVTSAVTICVILLGLVLIFYLLSKIFVPISQLRDSVKTIMEGSLNNKIEIKSNDEIGELAAEFNNMTARLQHYDQMNIDKLVSEKNKSLAIVNSMSDPVIVTDNEFNIVLINPMCESLFGITQDQATGRHILETINNRVIFDSISDVLSGRVKGTKDNQNTIFLEVDGVGKYYNITVAPIYRTSGKTNGAVTILQDITYLKEIEKLKSKFVSTVSHEFRTPLTSISMGVGLLLDGTTGTINDNQREIIEVIQEEGQRLAALVSDLLDLSRIESGKVTVNIKPCTIDAILQPTLKSLTEQANSKCINLNYYVYEKLPMVRADSDKIKVVLTNLIGNAIKFTSQGGKIEVFAHQGSNKVYISVKDNGIGIPREYQDKIFYEFVQVKQDVNDNTGTGLGLAIAKRLVELHGGDIWVDSEPGKGSTFTFTLKAV